MKMLPKRILGEAKLPAVLLTNPIHLQYLTDSDVETGALLITSKGIELYTAIAFLNNRRGIEKQGIKVFDRQDLKNRLKKIKRCGIESDYVTIGMESYMKKKYSSTKFVHISGILQSSRRQKSDTELRSIRKSWSITKQLLHEVPTFLRVGISEREVAGSLYKRALELGADGWAFEPIVGFGPNTSLLHHRAGSRILRSKDIVQMDIGVKVDRYCSDGSDVYFVGRPTDEQRQLYLLLQRTLKSVKKMVKPGVSTRSLDRLARSILQERNVEKYFTHALGHGVGLEIHEGVRLSEKAGDDRLRKHEVIAIEPGVYFPGKFGMRIEETVIVA